MKSRTAAHVFCLPYLALALDLVIVWAWTLISESAHMDPPPGLFIVLPFLGYYLLPTIAGIFYLFVCQSVLVLAWRDSPPPSRARRWVIAYNLVLLLYFAYLAWWFATGQQTKPIGGYL